jgi:F1F0 ATPase subunit 2
MTEAWPSFSTIGPIAIDVIAGMAFGAGYLALLWISVRRLAHAQHPLAGLLGGVALRMGLLLGGLYLLTGGQAERVVAFLVGFLVVRFAVTRWVGAGAAPRPSG